MTLDPGDETRRDGDAIGFESYDSALIEGDACALDSTGTVVPLSEGDRVLGVVSVIDEGRETPRMTVVTDGSIKGRVQSGTAQGDVLGAPNDTGTDASESTAAFGTFDDQDVIVLDSPTQHSNGNYYADVLVK